MGVEQDQQSQRILSSTDNIRLYDCKFRSIQLHTLVGLITHLMKKELDAVEARELQEHDAKEQPEE